jgi:hypothetical protein
MSTPKNRRQRQCRGLGLKNWRETFHFLTIRPDGKSHPGINGCTRRWE